MMEMLKQLTLAMLKTSTKPGGDNMENNLRRFTDEEIERANSINIINYAQSKGYPVNQISPRSYKIPGYGGLFIDDCGSRWNCFSKGTGGGTIQFVMEMEGKSWVDAVKELLGNTYEERTFEKVIKNSLVKGKMDLPEKNDTYKHIFAYLIKTRKIDQNIVNEFIDKKKIYEDKYKNCVFVGFNSKGDPAYASVRSTRTQGEPFRGDVRNSDKAYPFCHEGNSSTVCVFEAPIDLMSYLTLIKYHGIQEFKHHMISLSGVTDKALECYLKDHRDIDTIMLCLDNDHAGDLGCGQIHEKYGASHKILRHKPKGKDFNEELCQMITEKSFAAVREPPNSYFDGEEME